MKRMAVALALLAACQATTPRTEIQQSDFIRISYFRFDPVGDPTQRQYMLQPSAWVLYSNSWIKLRGKTKAESYFEAFPKWGNARVTEKGIILDPHAIALSDGVLVDPDMRDYLNRIKSAGLDRLPKMPEPAAEFFRKMQTTKEGHKVRMIRVETEKESFAVLFSGLKGSVNEPEVRTFLEVERYVLSLMTHNTRLIKSGVSPDR